jgi:hypothetical protein
MKPPKPHEKIENIEDRNFRVERDKAWETSWTRRLIIALGTYVIIGGYLNFLNVENAWLHALVPPAAYILSTLSLPMFKQLWINKIYKPKEAS